MTAQRLALALAVVALVAGLALLLTRSSVHPSFSNNASVGAPTDVLLARGSNACQDGELLAEGTGALRLPLSSAQDGPATRVIAGPAGGPAVARGAVAAGWSGRTLVVPLERPVTRDVVTRLCIAMARGGAVAMGVGQTPDGAPALRVDQLRSHRESWWDLAPRVAQRMGVTHAWGTSAVAVLAALLMLMTAVLALSLAARRAA